ncbi:NIPSNAP family containing protein [Pseudochryseolinea flava]|uniref:NIPSNAP family containing protein n=2 Tax=Pseudochryseolinea flava TaxID=2059302 RepID=A0A364Y0T5_9BACT|nr:NIPSNAP family containing protein [Pseudochryseolinea flava]
MIKYLSIALLYTLPCLVFAQKKATQEFYEIRTINISNANQEAANDAYLKQSLLPALHRAGIKNIGAFKPVSSDTVNSGKKIILLIPYQSPDQFVKIQDVLSKDNTYATTGKDYLDADYQTPTFDRIESIFLRAFRDAPKLHAPSFTTPRDQRIYELRSYEGHSQKIYKNKEHMFNEGGEILLFEKLKFNAVFYGEALIGPTLPNLMYMTSFENRSAREEHWKTFVSDPEWKKMSSLPMYQHNVSKITIMLLHPTDYSDY